MQRRYPAFLRILEMSFSKQTLSVAIVEIKTLQPLKPPIAVYFEREMEVF